MARCFQFDPRDSGSPRNWPFGNLSISGRGSGIVRAGVRIRDFQRFSQVLKDFQGISMDFYGFLGTSRKFLGI